jgi:hypothetical protein
MQLVEQHVIDRKDPRYTVIDETAFKSKNLYNAANYEMRQAFFHENRYLNYNEIQRRMQSHEAYKALPAKVSQQILMLLDTTNPTRKKSMFLAGSELGGESACIKQKMDTSYAPM